MEINLINSMINNSSLKTSEKSQSQYMDFDSMLSKTSYSSNNLKSNSTTSANLGAASNSVTNSDSKIDEESTGNNNSSSKVDDSEQVTQDVKDSLKDAGVSEDDLNKINNLKDLKEYVAEKILKGQSGDKVDTNALLAILASFMNGNFTKENVSDMKSEITKELQSMVESISKQSNVQLNSNQEMTLIALASSNGSDNNSILSELQKDLNSTVDSKTISDILPEIQKILGQADDSQQNDNILSKILGELSSVLKENSKNNKPELKDLLGDLKLTTKNFNVETIGQTIKADQSKQSTSSDLMSDKGDSSTSDDFLKSLLAKDTDTSSSNNDKISRATNFMSQFNNIKLDDRNIGQIENVVVNENNFSADMIKTLKYMETNDLKNLTVKITPKELGDVVINLTMEEGVMKASITASNKDAYNLLNSNLQDITNKLQNNDVKIQNLSLNIYNEDSTFFKDGSKDQGNNSQQNSRKNHGIAAISEKEEQLDNNSNVDNNVNILA